MVRAKQPRSSVVSAHAKRAPRADAVRTRELKIVAIGNSRGVRLPRDLLARYAIGDAVVLEERENGLLLRAEGAPRLSWEDTFKEMARERENFRDFDETLGDGLEEEPW